MDPELTTFARRWKRAKCKVACRLIIAGSRDLDDLESLVTLTSELVRFSRDHDLGLAGIVCGGATGMDMLGFKLGHALGLSVWMFDADWKKHGKAAGPIRNAEMADFADACLVIHHNTPGSLNMIRTAKAKGLLCRAVRVQKP